MRVDIAAITTVLKDVKQLQKHQRELEKIKGETFNIFSVLGVETQENKTHSNFIAELLNPKGSHFMGAVFLKAFLNQINYDTDLDISSVTVHKEFHIGKREATKGGRIDILIKDKLGNYLSIENKIYASDQDNQLIRYYNYKKGKNTLYYLTLFGSEASKESTEYKDDNDTIALKSGEEYQCLSYATDILDWLGVCREIAIDVPQLRDSIKQYILLIKKLTNQMVENEQEAINTLFNSFEASKYIADNFQNFRDHVRWKFREDVLVALNSKLDPKFTVRVTNPIHKKPIAQIFIGNKQLNLKEFVLEILIESFNDNGHCGGNTFIGILDFNDKFKDLIFNENESNLKELKWRSARFIKADDKIVNFQDNSFLNKIKDPKTNSYNEILKSFVAQCISFINDYSPKMESYVNKLNK